jgi:glycosyltransferase involved in cell wall biosynthesis
MEGPGELNESRGDRAPVRPGRFAVGETRGEDLVLAGIMRALDEGEPRLDSLERRLNSRPSVSVVIPAMNEELNLPHVLPKIGEWVDEVILVDGRSTDATCEIARVLIPGIRVIQQPGLGKGAALRSGFAAAKGDLIVMLDADGSTDPREIPIFVGALAAGAEFVKGTRFRQGGGSADMTWLRRAGNRAFVGLVRLLFGGSFSDLCYGYIAFWRRVLPHLGLDSDGFEIETEMSLRALHAGLRIAEVPSFERDRLHGKSNLRTFPDGWRVLKMILREKRQRLLPQHDLAPATTASTPYTERV